MPYRKASYWMLMLAQGVGTAIIVFFTGVTIWSVGPSIEARFLPVATKLNVHQMVSDPAGTKIESASFVKLRDCQFHGIAWFHILGGNQVVQVPVISMQQQPGALPGFYNRPTGSNVVGPWFIGLKLREVVYHSFARVEHRCHPFWITNTPFYP